MLEWINIYILKLDYLISYTEFKLKWIIDLNVQAKIIKLLKNKDRNYFEVIIGKVQQHTKYKTNIKIGQLDLKISALQKLQ